MTTGKSDNTAETQAGQALHSDRGDKPADVRGKATATLEKMLIDEGEAVIRTVVDRAKNGDMEAARLVLDRIVPAPKGRPVKIRLPKVETAADAPKAMETLLRATARGAVTPEEADILVRLVNAKRQAVEDDGLEEAFAELKKMTEDHHG